MYSQVNGNDVKTASHRHVVSLIRKTGATLVMKLISIDNGEHFAKPASPPANQNQGVPASVMQPPSVTPGNITSGNQDKQSNVIVNGTSHVDGPGEKKPPPIPSRAPTTSLSSRPKSEKQSVTGTRMFLPHTKGLHGRGIL